MQRGNTMGVYTEDQSRSTKPTSGVECTHTSWDEGQHASEQKRIQQQNGNYGEQRISLTEAAEGLLGTRHDVVYMYQLSQP